MQIEVCSNATGITFFNCWVLRSSCTCALTVLLRITQLKIDYYMALLQTYSVITFQHANLISDSKMILKKIPTKTLSSE